MKIQLETLRDALGYIAITGSLKSLHLYTKMEAQPYLKETLGKDGRLQVTDAGMEIAAKSRLYKAHLYLVEKGYEFQKAENLAKLSYKNDKGRRAHTGWRGMAYVNYKPAQQFKNG